LYFFYQPFVPPAPVRVIIPIKNYQKKIAVAEALALPKHIQQPMSEKIFRKGLSPHLPEKSVNIIAGWLAHLNLRLVLWNHRKTKLGDFRAPLRKGDRASVSVNQSLNPYSFLITLVHEIAHAAVYKTYGRSVKPHGIEWKNEYKNRLLVFLNNRTFPEELEREIAYHLINPKASATADIGLVKALRKYDTDSSESVIYVDDLNEGDHFMLSNGRVFIKGIKQRTRHQCIEESTQKRFLVSGVAEVKRVNK